jgi:hypothetical protein
VLPVVVVVPPPEPPKEPTTIYGGCNPGWVWNVFKNQCELQQPAIELVLQAIPYDKIAVVYDANKPINAANPIEIINKKMGGMNSLYKESNGDLHIMVGAVPTKANGIANSNTKLGDLVGETEVSAALYDIGVEDKLPASFISTTTGTITLDTLPRARARYGTVTSTFLHNGVSIPAGSVLVAIRKPDLIEVGRPSAKEGQFESYAIYNKSGTYLGKFGAQFGIENHKNLQFNYTPVGTEAVSNRFGDYKVYQDFEVDDLFTGLDTKAATAAWTNMQSDMAQRTQFDILSQSSDWTTKIFKQILETGIKANKDQDISIESKDVAYIANVIEYQSGAVDNLLKLLYPDIKLVDDYAKSLYKKQIEYMTIYAQTIADKANFDMGRPVVGKVLYADGPGKGIISNAVEEELSAKEVQSNKDIAKQGLSAVLKEIEQYNADQEAKAKTNSTNNSTKNNTTTSSSTNSNTGNNSNANNNNANNSNAGNANNNSNTNKNNNNNANANKNNNNNSSGGGLSGNSTTTKKKK